MAVSLIEDTATPKTVRPWHLIQNPKQLSSYNLIIAANTHSRLTEAEFDVDDFECRHVDDDRVPIQYQF
jgi:hypothetical protein